MGRTRTRTEHGRNGLSFHFSLQVNALARFPRIETLSRGRHRPAQRQSIPARVHRGQTATTVPLRVQEAMRGTNDSDGTRVRLQRRVRRTPEPKRQSVGELCKEIECKRPISPVIAKTNAADQTCMARVNRIKRPYKAAINWGRKSSPDQITIRLDRLEHKRGHRSNREHFASLGMLPLGDRLPCIGRATSSSVAPHRSAAGRMTSR